MALKHSAYRLLSRVWPAEPGLGLRVLLYHSVGGRFKDPYGTSIAPELFAAHIEALSARRGAWSFVPFRAPNAGRAELCVCFDDGYKDTLTVAAPVLRRFGIPFSVFVTSGNVDSGPLYLSTSELRELAALPCATIGAHGATHRPLDLLEDAELREEVASSRKRLEDLIGKQVVTMSYPHGRVDRRIRDAAAAAGYSAAGCSRYGLNTGERDPLVLCRTEITAFDSVDDLGRKADGRWDWFAYRHRDPAKC